MPIKRIKNFISDLGCGAPQFDLELDVSMLWNTLQAFHDTVEKKTLKPGEQVKHIRLAIIYERGGISCTDSQDEDDLDCVSADYEVYSRTYYVTDLIRYLINDSDNITDLSRLGIKKIWIQQRGIIHIQGTFNVLSTIERNLFTMNNRISAISGEKYIANNAQPLSQSFKVRGFERRGPFYPQLEELGYYACSAFMGAASIASFTTAVIALAGLISLPMPVVGLAFALCLALGAYAARLYYVAHTGEIFNQAPKYINLAQFSHLEKNSIIKSDSTPAPGL